MKRQAVFFIFLFINTTLSLCLGCGTSEPAQFTTYTDEVSGFSIDYPENWDVEPKDTSELKVAIWSSGIGFNAACIMVAKYEALGYNLQSFSQYRQDYLVENSDNYIAISTEESIVNNAPVIRHTYNENISLTTYTILEVYFFEEDTGWIIRFPCPQNSVDTYESTFNTALDSFSILR